MSGNEASSGLAKTSGQVAAPLDSAVDFRMRKWGGFCISLALCLLWSSAAHAQRVPLILVGIAGTSVFAPFVAVPLKFLVLRLFSVEVAGRRLWLICAIEWVLWFPAVTITLFSRGPFAAMLILPVLLALAVWLHREQMDNVPWVYALLLSLLTPILAVAIPSLAFVSAPLLEGYLPSWLL